MAPTALMAPPRSIVLAVRTPLGPMGPALLWGPVAFDAGLALGRHLGLCRLDCDEVPAATLGPALAVTIRN